MNGGYGNWQHQQPSQPPGGVGVMPPAGPPFPAGRCNRHETDQQEGRWHTWTVTAAHPNPVTPAPQKAGRHHPLRRRGAGVVGADTMPGRFAASAGFP
jgi:hypothetical protein